MRRISCAIVIAAVLGCADGSEVTQPVAARAGLLPLAQYQVDTFPTLFGRSQGGSINNRGWVAGFSGHPIGTRHAALWRNGVITDLSTLGGDLPGLHSAVQWPGQNNGGMVVGISHTAELDSLGEAWSCSGFIAATGRVCRGFAWEDDLMLAMPTWGGTHSFATGVNGRGQVVGWAETVVFDGTCNAPQRLQFQAMLWEPRTGARQKLLPLPGDATSAATAINERGQVAGISGECDVAIGRRSARRSVIWTDGVPTPIGDLGGAFWHTPMAINDRGDVVGFSNPPDGNINGDSLRAFVWTRDGGIRDLGKLVGDGFSQALSINARGQIVGVSCGAVCRAILWQNGEMYQLQDLVPGLADHLWSARSINDSGQITGRLIQAGTGRWQTFVATPVVPAP